MSFLDSLRNGALESTSRNTFSCYTLDQMAVDDVYLLIRPKCASWGYGLFEKKTFSEVWLAMSVCLSFYTPNFLQHILIEWSEILNFSLYY